MKKTPIALILGTAVMLLTVILFFTILWDVPRDTIHYISLAAVLVAELVTTVYACCIKANPRILMAAITSALMIPITVALSVVFVLFFPERYGIYLGWYSAGTVAFNLLPMVLVSFNAKMSGSNARLQDAKQNMLQLRKLVKCVLADPAAKPYEAQLKALEEKLHFSNDNVIANEDANIQRMLLQLQENISNPTYDHKQALQMLNTAVEVRNAKTSKNV